MIPWDRAKHPKWSEGLLQLAVAEYVHWWRCFVVPNLCLYHEMDVAVLTRAKCLWEFEIKVSQADWNADQRKDNPVNGWTAKRDLTYVDRFYYVVAPGLVAPDWMPDFVGILRAYEPYEGYVGLKSERRAKRRRAAKPTAAHCEAIYTAAHRRFWSRIAGLPTNRRLEAVAGAA